MAWIYFAFIIYITFIKMDIYLYNAICMKKVNLILVVRLNDAQLSPFQANMSIGTPTTATSRLYSVVWHHQHCFRLFTVCCSSSDSNRRCSFRHQPNANNKDDKKVITVLVMSLLVDNKFTTQLSY